MRIWRIDQAGIERTLYCTLADGSEQTFGRVPLGDSDLDVAYWLAHNDLLEDGDALVWENGFTSFISVHELGQPC
jgi:urease accessory protein UreE